MAEVAVLDELKILITGDSSPLRRELGKAEARSEKMAQIGRTAMRGLAIGAAGAAVAAGAAAKEFIGWEQAMVEVEKVAGQETAKKLGRDIREMAKTDIPLAREQLAGIAADAARFGVRGADNISRFTRTVAKMSVATNLSASQAGTALAKLGKLTDTPVKKMENLGSVVNELSNTAATSSQEIVDGMLRSSAALSSLGLKQTEIAGLQASLNEVSESSERAGTRLRRLGQELMDPRKVQDIAAAMGMNVEQFKQMRRESPVELIRMMATRLNEGGAEAEALRSVLTTVSQQALAGLGQNMEGLNKNLQTANEEFEKGTSLQSEFADASDTAAAKLQLAKNVLTDLGVAVGSEVIKTLEEMARAFGKAFGKENVDLAKTLKNVVVALRPVLVGVATALGVIARFVAENSAIIGPLAAGVLAAAGAFAAWTAATTIQTAAMGALGAVTLTTLAPLAAIAAAVTALILLWQNWDTVTQVLNDTFGDLTQVVEVIGGGFQALLQGTVDLAAGFADLLGDLLGWVADVIGAFARLQVRSLALLGRLAARGIATLLGFFGDALRGLAGWVASFLTRAGRFVGDLIGTWLELERRGLQVLGRWLGSLLGKFTSFIATSSGKVAGWVAQLLTRIGRFTGQALSRIARWAGNVVGEFAGLVIDALRAYGRLWRRLLTRTATGVGDVLGDIAAFVGDLASDLAGGARSAVGDFVTGFTERWRRIKTRILGVFDDILEAVPSFGEMWQAGRDIVEGLWAGVRQKWNEFVGWFEDRWRDLKNRFTGFFRMGSPSRLFERFGEQIVAGLQKGLRGLADVVQDELADLRARFTVAADVARGPRLAPGPVQASVVAQTPQQAPAGRRPRAQGGGGPTIQGDVVIPIEAPGGDPETVRDAVQEAIRDIFERGGGFRA